MDVIISGASKGIGRAIAFEFAAEGHSLFLTSRNKALLEQTQSELRQQYPSCSINVYAADLSQKESAMAFGNWAIKQGAVPDVLVNNAGGFQPGSISDEPEGVLEDMLGKNLFSAYHLTRSLLPVMKQNRRGHIFTLCSIASQTAYAQGGAYSISKFALYGFSKNLRAELMPHGIKVTHLLPGAVYTESWKDSGIPPTRMMTVADIARLVKVAASLSPQACVEEIVIRPLEGDL